MDALSINVIAAALGVAVLHTALGPDHYLPFVALSRARGWSQAHTLRVTAVCGLGHVLASVVLGVVGVGIGVGVAAIEGVEGLRGGMAAWLLVASGGAYALWGVRHAWRERRGLALHEHGGHVHVHAGGTDGHAHAHTAPSRRDVTFWTLFTVFVLGPCEPLIPLVILPASEGRWALAGAVAIVFAVATVATMLVLVALACSGARRVRVAPLERWSHALAGLVVAGSGVAVLCLGL